MKQTRFCSLAALVLAVVPACSSSSAPDDASSSDAAALADVGRSADAAPTADAFAAIDAGVTTDAAVDAFATDAFSAIDAQASVDAARDAGATTLDWHPGNYGLTNTSNRTARDAFLTGAIADSFEGVELIYPWTACEATRGDYSACFTAIDADLTAARAAGKHVILLLQYKEFGGPTVDAVPTYMQAAGSAFCVTPPTGPDVCGQYPTPTGTIALIWNDAVAARFRAWIAALGMHYATGGAGAALADTIAGIALPETAPGEATSPSPSLADVGYTSTNYIAAIEGNLLAASAAFPTKPVFQYINFLPHATGGESAALRSLGTFALAHPHLGLGCPDVGGNSTFHPPGYDTLMDATFQGHLPFNVAIEQMDFTSGYTDSLAATYAEATGPAPNGMAAQFVVWMHVTGAGNVFTIDDVASYLPMHPDPNTAPPF